MTISCANVQPDETLLLYPTAARLSRDGQAWKIPVHGIVLRPAIGGLVNNALLGCIRPGALSELSARRFTFVVLPKKPRTPRGPCRARFIRDGATGLGIEVRAGVHTGEIEIHGEEIHGSLSTSPRESSQWPSPVRSSCLAP